MADLLLLRGGTTTEHASFAGERREVTVDTTKSTLVVHDDTTLGGHPLAKSSEIETEALVRSNADTALQDNIDAEALIRSNVDTALQDNIDAEALARSNTDTTLQDNIDQVFLAGAISSYATSAIDVTVATPTGRNISVLDYTAATGTITLPTSAGMTIGGRVLIKKRNATMGSVNINKAGTDAVQWGAAQLRAYSEGDYWLIMWDGSRWCLLDGYETGSNANGVWYSSADGKLLNRLEAPASDLASYVWTFPKPFVDTGFSSSFMSYASTGGDYSDRSFNTVAKATTSLSFLRSQNGAANTNSVGFSIGAVGEWY